MNPITMSSIQNLAFLGVCERVHYVNQGHPVFHKHNIIGLKYTVVSHIYPINLEGFQLAFVVLQSKELPAIKVRGLLANDNELLTLRGERFDKRKRKK
jgi:hypothetical protein